jgi:ATP-dependent DNA helicase RecG
MIESSILEFKRSYTDEIKKEIVAFANTEGGELIIGVDDDGTVIGVDQPDQVSAQVANMLRDAIRPDVTLITKVNIDFDQDKPLVRVVVNKGIKKPYYLTNKGMTSAGVYVRQGNTSAPASADAIREMIRETDRYSYESNLSFEQSLTFDFCSRTFEDRGIRFGKPQMRTMKMMDSDGNYTNLAMLLSDQCFHTIQFAYFQGTEIGTFSERQRFSGSILKQLEDAFYALNRYNRTRSEISGLRRSDSRDYPEKVLREALINAIVHRDYDRDVSTNIRVFDDRVEIASYGGLPPNTTIDTFLLGLSMPRNRNLADIFYRLELIEAFGSGIPKMTEMYENQGKQIDFKTSPSGFMIVLPNLNYSQEKSTSKIDLHEAKNEKNSLLEQRAKSAVELIRAKGSIKRQELEKVWGISRSAVTNWLDQLIDRGDLVRIGHGRNSRYTIADLPDDQR